MADNNALESNLGWLMNRTGFLWRAVVDRYIAGLGLTQTRWVALLVLDKVGEGCSQSELAANIGVELPSLVRTLGQLEESGLIERRVSETDARCRTLWFTAAGKTVLADMMSIAGEGREMLLKGISTEQRRVLHDLLDTIIGNAQQVLGEHKDDRG